TSYPKSRHTHGSYRGSHYKFIVSHPAVWDLGGWTCFRSAAARVVQHDRYLGLVIHSACTRSLSSVKSVLRYQNNCGSSASSFPRRRYIFVYNQGRSKVFAYGTLRERQDPRQLVVC